MKLLKLTYFSFITNLEVSWTTNHGQHTERKTTSLAWTCLSYGPPAHTTASPVLAGTRIQERTKSELEGRSQQRPTKNGVHLGGSRGGSSWQTWMASECGPMCPVGYGLFQSQGQSFIWVSYSVFCCTCILKFCVNAETGIACIS